MKLLTFDYVEMLNRTIVLSVFVVTTFSCHCIKQPAVANFEKGPYAKGVTIKFRNSNDIYTRIKVYGLSIFVCGKWCA